MFSDNLRSIRKSKGISQEALAAELGVVRQTVSKWEKGLSVPDAQLLISLSEYLEVSVSTLLGKTMQHDDVVPDQDEIAKQLERLNYQISDRATKSHHRWRIAKIIVVTILAVVLLMMVLSYSR